MNSVKVGKPCATRAVRVFSHADQSFGKSDNGVLTIYIQTYSRQDSADRMSRS